MSQCFSFNRWCSVVLLLLGLCLQELHQLTEWQLTQVITVEKENDHQEIDIGSGATLMYHCTGLKVTHCPPLVIYLGQLQLQYQCTHIASSACIYMHFCSTNVLSCSTYRKQMWSFFPIMIGVEVLFFPIWSYDSRGHRSMCLLLHSCTTCDVNHIMQSLSQLVANRSQVVFALSFFFFLLQ